MRSNLATVWTQGLDPEAKESLEKTIRGSHTALAKLNDILVNKKKVIERAELSINDFDSNWAYKQAFRNGQRAAFKEITDLLSFLNNNED